MDYHVWGAMLKAYHKLKSKPKTSAKTTELNPGRYLDSLIELTHVLSAKTLRITFGVFVGLKLLGDNFRYFVRNTFIIRTLLLKRLCNKQRRSHN